MAEMKRATETFAWSGGLVHWGSELPADAEAVKAFPDWFEDVAAEPSAAPVPRPRKQARPKKAASDG